MSGNVVSLMALVPMLFHSIWGCCWHHGHPAVEDRAQISAVQAADAGRETACRVQARPACCHSHGRHDQTADAPATGDDRHEEAPCEQERCDFSVASQTLVPQSLHFEHSDAVCALVAVPIPPHALPTAVRRIRDDLRSHTAGDLRALIQVWQV